MFHRVRHWTPHYVHKRIQLYMHERRHPGHPWLAADAVRFLEQWVRPSDLAFEWGSGRSTWWLARRCATLISVEHNPRWYERVREGLKGREICNCTCELQEVTACDKAQPQQSAYVRRVDQVPDESLALVLVDGVAGLRSACLLAGMAKLQRGGLLILDNAEAYHPALPGVDVPSANHMCLRNKEDELLWNEVWESLRGWRRVWTSNGVFATVLLFKP